ncbi:MAG: hypothetical protein ACJARK_001395 [Marinobacter psychrophilus]
MNWFKHSDAGVSIAGLLMTRMTRVKSAGNAGLNASVAIDLGQNYGYKVILKRKISAIWAISERWIHTRFITGVSVK